MLFKSIAVGSIIHYDGIPTKLILPIIKYLSFFRVVTGYTIFAQFTVRSAVLVPRPTCTEYRLSINIAMHPHVFVPFCDDFGFMLIY